MERVKRKQEIHKANWSPLVFLRKNITFTMLLSKGTLRSNSLGRAKLDKIC